MCCFKKIVGTALVCTLISSPALSTETVRIGDFGPLMRIQMPKMRNLPMVNKVVGQTANGRPITFEQQKISELAHLMIAGYWKHHSKEQVKHSKEKTQAEFWREQNSLILANEKKMGRVTTKAFVLPGMTPSESERYYANTAAADHPNVNEPEVPQQRLSKHIGQPVFRVKESTGNDRTIDFELDDAAIVESTLKAALEAFEDLRIQEKEQSKSIVGEKGVRTLSFFEKGLSFLFCVQTAVASEVVNWNDLETIKHTSDAVQQLVAKKTVEKASVKDELVNQATAIAEAAINNEVPADVLKLAHAAKKQHIVEMMPNSEMQSTISDSPLSERKDPDTYIFISHSMSDDEILRLMNRNKGRAVTFVLRGVPDGMGFTEGMSQIQALASKIVPMPTVVIDPTLFRDYAVTQVPTIVLAEHEDGQNAKLLIKVVGMNTDDLAKEWLQEGKTGDQGKVGDSKPVIEPDLIEVMKERVQAIDWTQKKEQAIQNFWKNQRFKPLPTVTETNLRVLDPSIIVQRDIKDLNGNVIRHAGEVVNPLEMRPFHSVLIIFNPLKEEELVIAKDWFSHYRKEGKNVVLIATDFDKEAGWNGFEQLTKQFDAHVFQLTKEVQERWFIRATPTIVTASNEKKIFLIKELSPIDEKLRKEREKNKMEKGTTR